MPRKRSVPDLNSNLLSLLQERIKVVDKFTNCWLGFEAKALNVMLAYSRLQTVVIFNFFSLPGLFG